MIRTATLKDLEEWEKKATTPNDRSWRKTVRVMKQRGLIVVRMDVESRRIELIPTGTFNSRMREYGMNLTTVRSFRF